MYMKAIKKKIMIWALSAMAFTGTSAQQLTVKNNVIDCGNVVYEHPATVSFEMKNLGSAPLTISNIKTSCGCTRVDYPRTPIPAGDSFKVSATYDARQLGHFAKEIALYSNGDDDPVYLRMTGVVVEEIVDFSGKYPYTLGNLLADCNDVEFDDVNVGDRPIQKIHIKNNSDKTLTPVVMHLPTYLRALVSPTTLAPGRQGTVSLVLDSKKLRDYGLTQTSVFLGMFPGDKVHPSKEISVSAVLLPAFTEMTETQMVYAPKINLSSQSIDMPMNGKQKKTETITITNEGRTELDITSLQMFTMGLKVKLNKTKLQAGEQAKLKITVDAKQLQKARSKPRVLMITNDPRKPKVVIDINIH